MQDLGRLESVDVREYWKNEASDFTPWLAQESNINLLAKTINLDLEVESVEESIGLFRADIVCKDTLTGNRVLIENQLERTDHRHLGQLLTYAAGLDAVTIVWIANHFTEEHRASLDWLNEITGGNINFFGLEIELWRIGNSSLAPKLNIVSKPNDWTKSVISARQIATREISETNQLHLEYWTEFKNYLEENGQISSLNPRTPRPEHWYDFAIGRSGFHLSALTGMRDGFICLQLVMTDNDAKAYYHLLHTEKERIESELGIELDWRELPDKKRSDISIYRRNITPDNPSNWADYHQWLLNKLEAFYRVFAPRIQKLDVVDYLSDNDEHLNI